jgi:hypothetical protein
MSYSVSARENYSYIGVILIGLLLASCLVSLFDCSVVCLCAMGAILCIKELVIAVEMDYKNRKPLYLFLSSGMGYS